MSGGVALGSRGSGRLGCRAGELRDDLSGPMVQCMSALISIVIALVIIGVVLWAVQQLPIDDTIRVVIRVVVVLFAVLWLLGVLTGWHGFGGVHLPR